MRCPGTIRLFRKAVLDGFLSPINVASLRTLVGPAVKIPCQGSEDTGETSPVALARLVTSNPIILSMGCLRMPSSSSNMRALRVPATERAENRARKLASGASFLAAPRHTGQHIGRTEEVGGRARLVKLALAQCLDRQPLSWRSQTHRDILKRWKIRLSEEISLLGSTWRHVRPL